MNVNSVGRGYLHMLNTLTLWCFSVFHLLANLQLSRFFWTVFQFPEEVMLNGTVFILCHIRSRMEKPHSEQPNEYIVHISVSSWFSGAKHSGSIWETGTLAEAKPPKSMGHLLSTQCTPDPALSGLHTSIYVHYNSMIHCHSINMYCCSPWFINEGIIWAIWAITCNITSVASRWPGTG